MAYDVDLDLQHEMHQVKFFIARTADDKKPTALLALLMFLKPFNQAFHEFYRLCKITVSLLISMAACERSFSALRQIKTYVRNSMLDNGLSSVPILAIDKERTWLLHETDKIDVFATCHTNKQIALF